MNINQRFELWRLLGGIWTLLFREMVPEILEDQVHIPRFIRDNGKDGHIHLLNGINRFMHSKNRFRFAPIPGDLGRIGVDWYIYAGEGAIFDIWFDWSSPSNQMPDAHRWPVDFAEIGEALVLYEQKGCGFTVHPKFKPELASKVPDEMVQFEESDGIHWDSPFKPIPPGSYEFYQRLAYEFHTNEKDWYIFGTEPDAFEQYKERLKDGTHNEPLEILTDQDLQDLEDLEDLEDEIEKERDWYRLNELYERTANKIVDYFFGFLNPIERATLRTNATRQVTDILIEADQEHERETSKTVLRSPDKFCAFKETEGRAIGILTSVQSAFQTAADRTNDQENTTLGIELGLDEEVDEPNDLLDQAANILRNAGIAFDLDAKTNESEDNTE